MNQKLTAGQAGAHTRRRVSHWSVGLILAASVLTACTTTSSTVPAGQQKPENGGTAVFALLPGSFADWIFPFMSSAQVSDANYIRFQILMFKPLYWFGLNGSPTLNENLSLAMAPTFSNGGRTLTIDMKDWRWSNGEAVNAQDVVFWMNLLKTEKANWYGYVPGLFPDNVTSFRAVNPSVFQITFNSVYNKTWLVYNELSLVVPIPLAWDRTASGPSQCATVPADCPAVYNYLEGQGKDLSTYATNPLWQVVDGPWRLQSYQTTGYVKMIPNSKYSGPDRAKLAAFVEQPYTSASAELDALEAATGTGSSQTVNVGYIPVNDITASSGITAKGYHLATWPDFAINFMPVNTNNPTMGPLFKQLYFRQAFQELIDQPAYVQDFLHGYGTPTYGPVPLNPPNLYVTNQEEANPYPFSISGATALLRSHGWAIHPNGTDVCTGQCGPGVLKGTPLVVRLIYPSGYAPTTQMMEAIQSNAASAGIRLQLQSTPSNQALAAATPCKPSQAACSWQIVDIAPPGNANTFWPTYYPSGEELFDTDSAYNVGGFSDPKVDALITATLHSSSALALYENYVAKVLPDIWVPTSDYEVAAISNNLGGVTPLDSILNIYPQDWYLRTGEALRNALRPEEANNRRVTRGGQAIPRSS